MCDILFEQCPLPSSAGITNTYIIVEPVQKHAVIVDPAGEPDQIRSKIHSLGIMPAAILLTHAHYDHIAAMESLQKTYNIPIYCGIADKQLLRFSTILLKQLGQNLSTSVDHWLHGGENLTFGKLSLLVIATPGHSMGSLCFYESSTETLLSGDTLFFETIGRTDFPYEAMQGSIFELTKSLSKLFSILPNTTKILPGHGPTTTIGHERQFNPYLNFLHSS